MNHSFKLMCKWHLNEIIIRFDGGFERLIYGINRSNYIFKQP